MRSRLYKLFSNFKWDEEPTRIQWDLGQDLSPAVKPEMIC
jgi:hypothetical protein